MTAEKLLSNVNLYEIAFPVESSDVCLTFLNMDDGTESGFLKCTGVLLFSFHSPFGGRLPQYVGELSDEMVPSPKLAALLVRLGYGFYESPRGVSTPSRAAIDSKRVHARYTRAKDPAKAAASLLNPAMLQRCDSAQAVVRSHE